MKHKLKKDKIRRQRSKWLITITIFAFLISFIFSYLTEGIIPNTSIYGLVGLVVLFIILGVVFDMIGISVTTCDIGVFNSMASKKIRGGKTGIYLIKNAEKVSSFCNDVIGDICGIISGTTTVFISIYLVNNLSFNPIMTPLIITSIVASLTIGGKAYGKIIALEHNNLILTKISWILSFIKE